MEISSEDGMKQEIATMLVDVIESIFNKRGEGFENFSLLEPWIQMEIWRHFKINNDSGYHCESEEIPFIYNDEGNYHWCDVVLLNKEKNKSLWIEIKDFGLHAKESDRVSDFRRKNINQLIKFSENKQFIEKTIAELDKSLKDNGRNSQRKSILEFSLKIETIIIPVALYISRIEESTNKSTDDKMKSTSPNNSAIDSRPILNNTRRIVAIVY